MTKCSWLIPLEVTLLIFKTSKYTDEKVSIWFSITSEETFGINLDSPTRVVLFDVQSLPT